MILSRLIAIGFLGSIFAMCRFGRYCRLLNCRDLEPEEAEFFQRKARWWLKATGALMGLAVLSILAGIVVQ